MELFGGGSRRGYIVIMEGREGRGWRSSDVKLENLVAFFELSHNGGSKVVFSRQPNSGLQSTVMGGSLLVFMGKVVLIGGGKTYVEVLGRAGLL